MNDRVEFSVEVVGDKHFARNITKRGGRPLSPSLIRTHFKSDDRAIPNDSDLDSFDNTKDTRIRVSSVIHPMQRLQGVVISETKNDFGWILCNVRNSLPVRYHISQIQSTGSKRLVLHSRVELNVVRGRDHDWSFYITKPGGNLITFEKPDVYGQWLRSLELFPRLYLPRNNIESPTKVLQGFVCEYYLRGQIGFITPFDELGTRYMFHIDNCSTAKCENRRVFINDEVEFEVEWRESMAMYYAINIRSLSDPQECRLC